MRYTRIIDFRSINPLDLAHQLRDPRGKMGEELGAVMAEHNTEAMAFCFECLKVRPEDHVLEIGFGPGEAIAEAARLTPKGFVAGIDHSETMLKVAMERNHRATMEERVELTLGDARKLPYTDASFDKVFAVNVFHFWPDPSRELKECRRVLKPNGLVLFYLTHPSSWLEGLNGTGVFIARESADIEKILIDTGFTNVTTKTITSKDGKGFVVLGTR